MTHKLQFQGVLQTHPHSETTAQQAYHAPAIEEVPSPGSLQPQGDPEGSGDDSEGSQTGDGDDQTGSGDGSEGSEGGSTNEGSGDDSEGSEGGSTNEGSGDDSGDGSEDQ